MGAAAAANAYAAVAQAAATPRQLEGRALMRTAALIEQAARDIDDDAGLESALDRNRRLWLIFIDGVSDDAHPGGGEFRASVLSLGAWVLKRSLELLARPTPEGLRALAGINRTVAGGLDL